MDKAEADRELSKTYKRLFSTEDGQKILQDLEKRVRPELPSYTLGCNPNDVFFQEGKRALLSYIITDRINKDINKR